jgi:hypothetical protein
LKKDFAFFETGFLVSLDCAFVERGYGQAKVRWVVLLFGEFDSGVDEIDPDPSTGQIWSQAQTYGQDFALHLKEEGTNQLSFFIVS